MIQRWGKCRKATFIRTGQNRSPEHVRIHQNSPESVFVVIDPLHLAHLATIIWVSHDSWLVYNWTYLDNQAEPNRTEHIHLCNSLVCCASKMGNTAAGRSLSRTPNKRGRLDQNWMMTSDEKKWHMFISQRKPAPLNIVMQNVQVAQQLMQIRTLAGSNTQYISSYFMTNGDWMKQPWQLRAGDPKNEAIGWSRPRQRSPRNNYQKVLKQRLKVLLTVDRSPVIYFRWHKVMVSHGVICVLSEMIATNDIGACNCLLPTAWKTNTCNLQMIQTLSPTRVLPLLHQFWPQP